ncbi:AraC family transcriptional regulator ligand-binding domain-containing protein [Pseudoalteromonas sp. MMG012]|uniref:AraC family transcriptional regulator n=1 Tax=Pseudoalteromonas sp. MMG012 TaxID=2822686 RepID=UPI001B3A763F|nr:AraC family transcriptional regulator ligand-binding domain-containing protein [Pseudoalteromonas sp. MMG012]MBQ4849152.1 AraC family transcriptional regulator ligand-binding domain-containing protein [Pseudoalteromonas sp. MMG012]
MTEEAINLSLGAKVSDVSQEYCKVVAHYLPERYCDCRRIPMAAYLQAIDTAVKIQGDSLWGFNTGKAITSAEYGLLGYLVETSDTVGCAIDWLLQFDKTVANIGDIQFTVCDSSATLVWRPYFHNRHAVLRNMTAWVATVRRISGQALTPSEMHFSDAFTHEQLRLMEVWFNCPVKDKQTSNRIEFPVSLLAVKLITRNEVIQAHLLISINELASGSAGEHQWLSQLQLVLHSCDLHTLTLSVLAQHLSVSTRTLQRKLTAQKLSFSQLKDKERLRRFGQFGYAMRKQELSDLLGYKEQASLNRAVRRWYGMSPSAYLNETKNKI